MFGPLTALPTATVARLCDVAAGTLFLVGTSRYLRKRRSELLLARIPEWIIAICAIGVGALSMLAIQLKLADVLSQLPSVTLSLAAIFGLATMFDQVVRDRDERAVSKSRILLVGGALTYATIQPLALMSLGGNWYEVAGFSLGYVSKLAMVVGLAGGFVMSAETTVRAEALHRRVAEVARTIGRITHELGTPIRHLDIQVAKLRRISPAHGEFATHLVGLENTVLRVDAVIEATLALLPSPDKLIDLSSVAKNPQAALPSRAADTVNVNTLLQLALVVVKKTRGEQVLLRTSFSGNCCISCVQFELVQVFINLLRNAYDAMAAQGRGTLWLSPVTSTIMSK